ncbi:MAG: hypothetical protein DRQ88_08700 [Epsilonproteobacteria bacterium]|nr:MAG: hypothetical protein DRQ89_07665 [Campylobacterota bacterium]RLA65716.1 MAG: hypothetical protein DRQ88_08700 [Campylobacterota bacterium]
MIKFEKKYLKILGLSLSFPSFILALAWGFHELIKVGFMSPIVGWSLFFLVIANFIFLLIKFAFQKKK